MIKIARLRSKWKHALLVFFDFIIIWVIRINHSKKCYKDITPRKYFALVFEAERYKHTEVGVTRECLKSDHLWQMVDPKVGFRRCNFCVIGYFLSFTWEVLKKNKNKTNSLHR